MRSPVVRIESGRLNNVPSSFSTECGDCSNWTTLVAGESVSGLAAEVGTYRYLYGGMSTPLPPKYCCCIDAFSSFYAAYWRSVTPALFIWALDTTTRFWSVSMDCAVDVARACAFCVCGATCLGPAGSGRRILGRVYTGYCEMGQKAS